MRTSEELPEWYIRQLGDEAEARELYEWYVSQQRPAMLFRNTFMGDWLVAAYASDATHTRAGQEVSYGSFMDGYLGAPRLAECLAYHLLIETNMERRDAGGKGGKTA